jgi:hypothetical protein
VTNYIADDAISIAAELKRLEKDREEARKQVENGVTIAPASPPAPPGTPIPIGGYSHY